MILNFKPTVHLNKLPLDFTALWLGRELMQGSHEFALVVLPAEREAEEIAHLLSLHLPYQVQRLAGFDFDPLSSAITPEQHFFDKIKTLHQLHKKEKRVLVTTLSALMERLPPKSIIERSLTIKKDQIISPLDLADDLRSIGMTRHSSLEGPGTFAIKGERFDIYLSSGIAVRLIFFDELIESIFPIDIETNRSLSDLSLDEIDIPISSYYLTNPAQVAQLRVALKKPSPGLRTIFEERERIFTHLQNGELFEDWPSYLPLFFSETTSLFDYITCKDYPVYFYATEEIEECHFELLSKINRHLSGINPVRIKDLISPSQIYDVESITKLQSDKITFISALPNTPTFLFDLNSFDSYQLRNQQVKTSIKEFCFSVVNGSKTSLPSKITFLCKDQLAEAKIKEMLGETSLSMFIFEKGQLYTSYYEGQSDELFISDREFLLGTKQSSKKQKKQDLDLFAEQLSTLEKGDYVIHANHGIGRYKGLEAISLQGQTADFLVLEYDGGDKVFVPFYKLNLIQKYGGGGVSQSVASLRNNKFEKVKSLARESVKKLAFDLIKLLASREINESYAFSPPGPEYFDFAKSFPYQETPDQESAINETLQDLQAQKPMDRLVCGDVGFGKTEVAMRAAFKAAIDGKQVAVLVPTTILALQHYHSFVERFKNFPITIDFLSRLRGPKESLLTSKNIEDGKVDIIIGTHKILSQNIKFKDLGLLIIDEEQRFGVGHKEQLKLFRATVDCLTLTATPIPRTLQLSLMGLKDMSVITTPPPRRQSIQTLIVHEDEETIKEAIQSELKRGGQVFYLHNRVEDLEEMQFALMKLIPELTIVIGHGQLPERELEKRMNDFYLGKYRLLLCTTIIESGIDIPNANTLIVNNAHMFGLSQLHQIRGRVGRSDKKAYAYFVIPKDRTPSSISLKRLQVLQTHSAVGSGFQIASNDLDLRGAGNILGAEQSGNIESIGMELYMELLSEAIAELRGSKKSFEQNIEISTPFAAYIPSSYIASEPERLKQYKRLANEKDQTRLDQLEEEFYDLYGPLPIELKNLLTTLKVKISLKFCPILSLKVIGNTITMKFSRPHLDSEPQKRDRMVDYFISHHKQYKMNSDLSVIYSAKEAITSESLLTFAKTIAEKIDPC